METDAYAVQFSFDLAIGGPHRQFDLRLPASLIGIAAASDALPIIHEKEGQRDRVFRQLDAKIAAFSCLSRSCRTLRP